VARLLLLVLLLFGGLRAWAQPPLPAGWVAPLEHHGDGDDDHDDDHDDDREDDHDDHRDQRPTPREHSDDEHAYDDHYAYYGRVRVTAPAVIVGQRRLIGDLALLGFLAPGMQVEVTGRVQAGALRVERLRVLYPRRWAYYEGPLPGEGWRRIWFKDGRPWRYQAIEPGPRVRLLACYDGGWQGLPPALLPEIGMEQPGRWLLEGLYWQGGVRWTRFERLGACGK